MNARTKTLMRIIPCGILGLSVLTVLIFEEIKSRSTKNQMDAIAELIAGQDDEIIVSNKDAWGTYFEIENSDDSIRVISAGPDKVIHTTDDILGKWHGKKKSKLPRDEKED